MKRLCMENLNMDCRNPQKKINSKLLNTFVDFMNLECPHCLRINGKDGHGNVICEPEKAEKLFEIFKDKLEGNEN